MKMSINGTYLHEISMKYFDLKNASLRFPEHRVELIGSTGTELILAMPEKLVVQLFLNNILSKNEKMLVKIKIEEKKNGATIL